MKQLTTLRDSSIFGAETKEESVEYTKRPTVKAFVFDRDGYIALLRNKGKYTIPGGGIERGEDKQEALAREAIEEIGCQLSDIREYAVGVQYRAKTKKEYEIYFFTAKVFGDKGVRTTVQEDEVEGEVLWVSIEEAESLLGLQSNVANPEEYSFCFNARHAYEALGHIPRE